MRLLLLLHRTHTQKKNKKKNPQCNRTDAARFACLLKLELIHLQAFFFFFSSTPFFPSEIVTARRSLQLAVRCVATPPPRQNVTGRSVGLSGGCVTGFGSWLHVDWKKRAAGLTEEACTGLVCARGGEPVCRYAA